MYVEGYSRIALGIVLILFLISINMLFVFIPISSAARAVLIVVLNGGFCVGAANGYREYRRKKD